MTNEFEIKILRNLKYFHGMEVAKSREGIDTPPILYQYSRRRKKDSGTARV